MPDTTRPAPGGALLDPDGPGTPGLAGGTSATAAGWDTGGAAGSAAPDTTTGVNGSARPVAGDETAGELAPPPDEDGTRVGAAGAAITVDGINAAGGVWAP